MCPDIVTSIWDEYLQVFHQLFDWTASLSAEESLNLCRKVQIGIATFKYVLYTYTRI